MPQHTTIDVDAVAEHSTDPESPDLLLTKFNWSQIDVDDSRLPKASSLLPIDASSDHLRVDAAWYIRGFNGNMSWSTDIFQGRGILRGSILPDAPLQDWLALTGFCLAGLIVDVRVLRRFWGNSGLLSNMIIVCFWVFVALCYNLYYLEMYGSEAGLDWMTGYLLEWMLSVDNLFVFHLIFKTYKTPNEQLPQAVLCGILGAAFFRMFLFALMGSAIQGISAARYVFGAVLIYSGIQAARGDDDETDCDNTVAVQVLKWGLGSRLIESYDVQGRFFIIGNDSQYCATMLFLVACLMQAVDLMFAVDSVTAKVAQIDNLFCAYSSSVFAMLGLGNMFFVLRELVGMFELLNYGICAILCFIGFEVMLADYIDVGSRTVLTVIGLVFLISIVGSVWQKRSSATSAIDASGAPDDDFAKKA